MTPIRTRRLLIRNWEDRDRDLFFRINSDEQVMAFFPFRRTRAESDAFLDKLRLSIEENGFGFTALENRETGACMGFAGLNRQSVVPTPTPDTVEIGWRLAPEYWGKGYVTEAADSLLAYGFRDLDLDEIVSFAVWNNERSTAVMKRIGMRRDPAGDFDHPGVPDTHPHLKRHVLYRLSRPEWQARQGRDGA
ncbi:MAG: GNAT family N-acetyltransferase [Rhizobiaceae bacterium]